MADHKANVISILNFKGGVGKTTTTLNLGAALARKGKRVLLIDLDVQMNTTNNLGYSIKDGESVYELLAGINDGFPVYDTNEPNLQFIPSSTRLDVLASMLANETGRELVLREKINPLFQIYDFVLIDCPPGKSVLTDNAICASDYVIIPTLCEEMCQQGLVSVITKIDTIKKRLHHDAIVLGFLLTRYDKREKVDIRTMYDILAQINAPVFKTVIRKCVSLSRFCQYQNVFVYDEKSFKSGFGRKFAYSNGADDYLALADELLTCLRK